MQERVGRVAGVDVLRAQVNELRSEATLTTARASEANAREALELCLEVYQAEGRPLPPSDSYRRRTVTELVPASTTRI